jgi:hypothetical protein
VNILDLIPKNDSPVSALLRADDPAPDDNASCLDLIYAELSELAESLDCLTRMPEILPYKAALDGRIAVLRQRTALIDAQIQISDRSSVQPCSLTIGEVM